MTDRKENRQYVFTMEGETEQMYLYWMRDCINSTPAAKYNVTIIAKIQQSPMKYAKTVNPIAIPTVTHICDYESEDEVHIKKFNDILSQLKKSKQLSRPQF